MCLVCFYRYSLRLLSFFTGPYPKSGSFTFLWFALFHPEKLESAQSRYANELMCIVGILDRVLKGKKWLLAISAALMVSADPANNENIAPVRLH